MKKKILITGGKVHDVGYRLFLMREVRKLGIPNHYAENVIEDGKQKVEVFIEGDEKQSRTFVNFIRENYPVKAKVSEVKETSELPDRVMPVDEYDKLLSAEQQSKIVQAGLGMLEKQDQALERQDKMLGKQDQALERQDKMLEKQDQTLNILKDIKTDTSQIKSDTSGIPSIESNTCEIKETLAFGMSEIIAIKESSS